MRARDYISGRLPAPRGVTETIKSGASNKDIISEIHASLPLAIKQVSGDVANWFRRDTVSSTAWQIWHFLKKEIHYVKDDDNQKIKLPAAFVADSTGDCKSYTLFSAAVLSALNIPYVIRYAGYEAGATQPQHVYVVADGGVIIDAVWSGRFGTEKKYTFVKDYKMNIQRVSGVGAIGKGKVRKAVKQAARKTAATVKKGVKSVLDKARQAFLLLVSTNIKGFSTVLSKADVNKVRAAWTKLGGKPDDIINAIHKGVGKKATISGIENARFAVQTINGVGAVATVSAALAAAIPVIKQFGPLLADGKKNMGKSILPKNKAEAGKFLKSFAKKRVSSWLSKGSQETAPAADDTQPETEPNTEQPQTGMSTTAKVAIGLALAAVTGKVLKMY